MPIATNPQTGETVYLTENGTWEKAQTAVNPQTKETLAFDGNGWAPVKQQSKGVLGHIDDAVRSIASGITFGYADELAAKMDELTGRGGSYAENLAKEKAKDEQISNWLKVPAEIGGAVAGSVATAPVLGPMAAASGLSKLPAAVRAAGIGAGSGALYGSGSADPGDRLLGAAVGAGIGAPLGAVTPSLIRGAGAVGGAVKNLISPEANVAKDLGRALVRDKDIPEQIVNRAQDVQIERPGVATLADVGGENVKGLVERVAQTPGAGRTKIIPALTARQQGQMYRISSDLKELTGTTKNSVDAISETMEKRATSAKPLYDKAFEFDVRSVPEIVDAFTKETSTGWGQSILKSKDLSRTLQTEYGIKSADDAPLSVLIDAWKKTADDIVSDNLGTNKGRVVKQMRDRIIDLVDKHNPAYATARNAWAGPSQYLDAIKEGRNILSTKISSQELAAALDNMPENAREGYTIGAISSIIGKMGSDPAKLGDMTKYLRSPEARAKIAAIMPTQEARESWAKRLDFEVASSEMTGRALGNSATARRLAERGDADGIVMDLVTDAARGASAGLLSFLSRSAMVVPKKIRDTLRSRSDDILAELLTDPDGMAKLRQAMSRIDKKSKTGLQSSVPAVVRSESAILE